MPRRPDPAATDGGSDARALQARRRVGDVDEHDRGVAGRDAEPAPEAVGQSEVMVVNRGDTDFLEQPERGASAARRSGPPKYEAWTSSPAYHPAAAGTISASRSGATDMYAVPRGESSHL